MWASEKKLLYTYRSSALTTPVAMEQDTQENAVKKTKIRPKASLSYIPHAKLEVIVVTITMLNEAPILVATKGTHVEDMTSSLASTMAESLISVVERTDRVFPDLLDDLSNKSYGNNTPQRLSIVKFVIKHRDSQESKLHYVPDMDVVSYLNPPFELKLLAHKTIQHIQNVYPVVEAYINQQWF